MEFEYDVIVVGGGHAGCEASCAAARLGARTLLITGDLNRVAQMSCNPAVGGIAKGQIVREIDALGGQMGIIADETAIQFRMLNRSKGAAVWSPRVQSDRVKFTAKWRSVLENTPNLRLFQDNVTEFVFGESESGRRCIKGVRTALGLEFSGRKVILTAGTFLNGLMHFGENRIGGGRISEAPVEGLTEQLAGIGFTAGRMKTGTPMRIDGRTIDFSLVEAQEGDDGEKRDFHGFSFMPGCRRTLKPCKCYIVHTNEECHRIIRDNLHRSPLYNGSIQSIGPRYCPSIETKIVTFADKPSHQLFLEPEGEESQEYYVNGFSSSLPFDVQLESIRKIPALRNVHFLRPGYAIEYDFFDPTQLTHDLQTKLVDGLYFAGQVNGTTGYEEAAAQGLMAGINAALSLRGEEPLVLARDEAYIGVLIDDLVTRGVDEPYRMFTSRAEYRILLRQDDADFRLTPIGYRIGLVDEARMNAMRSKRQARDELASFCREYTVKATESINSCLAEAGTTPLERGTKIAELVKRPQLALSGLAANLPPLAERIAMLEESRRDEIVESVEILLKYEGYILRERENAQKLKRLEDVRLRPDFPYEELKALSTEARQKLSRIRPQTLGQASRIPGVSPSDVNVLLVSIGR